MNPHHDTVKSWTPKIGLTISDIQTLTKQRNEWPSSVRSTSDQDRVFGFGFAEHSRSCFTCQPCISHGKPERRCHSPRPEQINAETAENELRGRQNPSHPQAIATSTTRMESAQLHRSGRTKTKHPRGPPIRRPAGTQGPKSKRGAIGERSPPEKQWPGRLESRTPDANFLVFVFSGRILSPRLCVKEQTS